MCLDPAAITIDGGNTPILTKLGAWKFGFNSPFKAEVYFVNTKQFTDLKWGTSNPVMMRDTDFGMVRLRAFGIYSIRVTDPRALIKEDRRHQRAFRNRRYRGPTQTNFSERLQRCAG